jgi:hypothetical protein
VTTPVPGKSKPACLNLYSEQSCSLARRMIARTMLFRPWAKGQILAFSRHQQFDQWNLWDSFVRAGHAAAAAPIDPARTFRTLRGGVKPAALISFANKSRSSCCCCCCCFSSIGIAERHLTSTESSRAWTCSSEVCSKASEFWRKGTDELVRIWLISGENLVLE